MKVGAWDGQYGSNTEVNITILNINDQKPQFEKEKYTVHQTEEHIPSFPIQIVKAIGM